MKALAWWQDADDAPPEALSPWPYQPPHAPIERPLSDDDPWHKETAAA